MAKFVKFANTFNWLSQVLSIYKENVYGLCQHRKKLC